MRLRVPGVVDRIRHHRHRNQRLYRYGGRGLVVVIAVVAIALVALVVQGRMEVMRLSGTAAVQVVSSEVRVGSSYDQSPAGSTIRYTYVVNGATYLGIDFRRWLNVDSHAPKVCFDPADPAKHLLVEGTYTCGRGP
jgi:hypothetical protein